MHLFVFVCVILFLLF